MGLPKRLTEMQMRFAEFLVFGDETGPLTQTEAAVKAGYSPKRARQEGSELCNPKLSPLVVKYIGELREERLKKHEVTYEGHVAELARLREAALKKGSFSSAVNAEANQRQGSRIIHRQKNNKNWETRRHVRTRIRSKDETNFRRLRSINKCDSIYNF